MNTLKKTLAIFRKEIITTLLFLLVLGSFGWHISHRNQHFQECDSGFVYQVIREFPKSAITNSAPADAAGGFLSKTTVQKILGMTAVKNLRLKYFSNISEEEIAKRLISLQPAAFGRLVARTFLATLKLPYFIQAGLAVPFSSTYSFGSGLVYGLVTHRNMTYDDFMSLAMLVSQFLFHASVMILFLTCVHLGLKRTSAACASLLILFSISMYSYGYHLGNTVWNYSTAFLWLFFLVINLNHPKLLKRMSWLTAILIFFNYLIVLYWGAFLVAYFFVIARIHHQAEAKQSLARHPEASAEGSSSEQDSSLSLRMTVKELPQSLHFLATTVWRILKSQWVALVAIIFVAGLFYPPGQGNRGTTSVATFFSDVYYVVLNFFSFYNHHIGTDILQFIIGALLLIGALVYIFRSDRFEKNKNFTVLKKTAGGVILLFVALAIFGVLGFAPSRHILFIAPVVFVFVAIFIDRFIFTRFNEIWLYVVLGVIVLLGVFSLSIRAADVRSLINTVTIPDDKDITSVVVQDCAVDFVYRDWHTSIPVDYAKPYLFVPGKTYLYLSPTIPFAQALTDWQWPLLKYPTAVTAEVVSDYYASKDFYFTAYNPRHFYNHWPNSVHVVLFKVLGITIQKPQ